MKLETIKQCAKRVNLPASHIRGDVISGKYAAAKIGNKYYVDADAVDKYYSDILNRRVNNHSCGNFDFLAALAEA